MKKKIIASVIAALLSTTALADTSSLNADVADMGILQNEWVRAGVNGRTGTFGSGGNTSPGLLFDPTGTGTFDPSYDYLTPGSPFDGVSVKIDGVNYTNNNDGGTQIREGTLTDGVNTLSWTGSVEDKFSLTSVFTLAPTKPYIDITSSITMLTGATTLSFGKFIDPDSQGMPGDSSSTDNVLGYGVIPSTNVAFSEATVSRYALGIYTTDTNVTAGVNGWETDADAYNGTNYYKPALDADGNIQWDSPSCTNIAWCGYQKELDADGNPVKANYGNGDDTIGISWTWSNVSAGDILTASYAYIFGPSAFDAASDAVTGGAGGGDTTTTDSWGTVTDVGSATDAASGVTPEPTPDPEPEAPTVTGTSTTTISSTAEAPSTTLPVLTASITHHTATDDSKVQTIARERTTTVTTPIVVTTTSFDRTVTTYSDGSTTTTDGSTTTTNAIRNDVETTVTDPGSFVGRIDQMSTANDMLSMANRNLSFDGVNFVRDMNKMDNGMTGGVTGLTVGGTRDLENGWSIGAGVGKLSTSVRNDGSADVDTTLVNVHGGRSMDLGTINFGVTHAMNDYTSSRTIGDFANTSKTSETDTWANVTFKGNGEYVRPIVGITRGVRSIDGFTEAGSIQSARTVAGSSDWYTFGTVGAEATITQGVNITALHHTDGVNSLALSVNKEIQKDTTLTASAGRTISNMGSANSIMLGLVKKF